VSNFVIERDINSVDLENIKSDNHVEHLAIQNIKYISFMIY